MSFCRRVLIGELALVAALWALPSQAEFLEMPEIKQVPELRTKSLLRDMDIPELKFRSPDPNEGPRLAIKEFRIQGLVEYPKMGVTREALAKLSERIRFDMMEEGKILDSGYTISELAEVSEMLGKIEEETVGRHVEPVDVQRLVWLIREQREKRGITLGQIETVANTITQFYRERGFVLAKAYIPKQEVRDGVVNLTVLLGMLGDVQVAGNKRYSTGVITSSFSDMLGKPVTNTAIEERLFLINDYPGIFVDGYFEPGYQVGDTRLKVNVKDESTFNGAIRMDDHGTEETGLYRFYGDVKLNNPLGMADVLQLSGLYTSQPSNSKYWQVLYSLKFFSPRVRLALDASENQYVVDQTLGLPLSGAVKLYSVTGTYLLDRGRKSNNSFDLKYEKIQSDISVGGFKDPTQNDGLKNISLAYRFDALQEEKKRFHQGQLKLTSGSFYQGLDAGQDEQFNILTASYSMLDFWKLPWFGAETRLVYRLEWQYSGTSLSGIMRFSLSGPTRSRGYAPGYFTADDAMYLGFDWLFNSPEFLNINITKSINLKEFMKPFLFVDYGYGIQHVLAINSDNTGRISDAGFGFKLAQGKSFSGNLLAAFPLGQDFTNLTTPPAVDNYRVIFDFQYTF